MSQLFDESAATYPIGSSTHKLVSLDPDPVPEPVPVPVPELVPVSVELSVSKAQKESLISDADSESVEMSQLH